MGIISMKTCIYAKRILNVLMECIITHQFWDVYIIAPAKRENIIMIESMNVSVVHLINITIVLCSFVWITQHVLQANISNINFTDVLIFLNAIMASISIFQRKVVNVWKDLGMNKIQETVQIVQLICSMIFQSINATTTEHAYIMNISTKPFISVWSHPHVRKEVITTRLF